MVAETLLMETIYSIDSVTPAEWASVAAGRGLYFSRPWLRALERDGALETRYTLARDGERELTAAMPSYLWAGDGGWTTSTYDVTWPVRKLLGENGVRRDEWFPTLLVGGRSGYVNEPLALAPAAAAAVSATSFALAGELGARSGAALYLTRRGADEIAAAADGIVLMLWGVTMRMEIEWDDFGGYVASLNAHRRTTVRRDLKRFAAGDATVTVEPLGPLVEQAASLTANVQRRYGNTDTPESLEAYLHALAEHLDAQSRVFAARRGDDLVGFGLAFEHERCLYMRLVGFDYERMGDEGLYFEVCYYAPIRYASEHGLEAIDFGAASHRPKLLRGARPSPRFVAVAAPEACREAVGVATDRWNEGALAWFREELEPFGGSLSAAEWLPPQPQSTMSRR